MEKEARVDVIFQALWTGEIIFSCSPDTKTLNIMKCMKVQWELSG